MELLEGFSVIDSKPGAYCEPLDAVVVSDFHIGIESVEARTGTLMPRFQMEEMLNELEEMCDETGASLLVITGDIKHSFGGRNRKEREELDRFLNGISMLFDEVWLVRGNHDNALEYRVEEFVNVELEDYFLEEGILFVHGHERLEDLAEMTAETVVIGHEHPSVVLKDEVGITEKVPCFLYGSMKDGRELLVLPAFSKLASGTDVNDIPEHQLLSPILKKDVELGSLKVLAVDREAGCFAFPELEKLRGL